MSHRIKEIEKETIVHRKRDNKAFFQMKTSIESKRLNEPSSECLKQPVELWPNKNSDQTYSIRTGTHFNPKGTLWNARDIPGPEGDGRQGANLSGTGDHSDLEASQNSALLQSRCWQEQGGVNVIEQLESQASFWLKHNLTSVWKYHYSVLPKTRKYLVSFLMLTSTLN